jgi:hypothetical protein
MEQYISKSALVAEIERLIKKNELYLDDNVPIEVRYQKTGAYSVLNDLLHFIGTLEAKDVDLEKEIKDYFNNQPIITRNKGIDYQFIPSNEDIAKHFFELGLNAAQKGE